MNGVDDGIDVIGQFPLPLLMKELGFELPRRGNRTRCIIHGGDGLSFAFDNGKGVWKCHACGESGGKLKLVELVLKLDRSAAFRWMAERQGIPLIEQTEQQRREYQQRAAAANSEAHALVDWREGLLTAVTDRRDELMGICYSSRGYLRSHSPSEAGSPAYEAACTVSATYWPRVEEMDGCLDVLRGSDFRTLLPFFREKSRSAG